MGEKEAEVAKVVIVELEGIQMGRNRGWDVVVVMDTGGDLRYGGVLEQIFFCFSSKRNNKGVKSQVTLGRMLAT